MQPKPKLKTIESELVPDLESRMGPELQGASGGCVCVGRIRSPHGVGGAVCVESYTEAPEDLLTFSSFMDVEGRALVTIDRCLSRRGPRTFVVTVVGVEDRTAAERLADQGLHVPRDRLPHLEAEIFYRADLVGLRALAEDGTLLGTVSAVDNFGGGDLLEIRPVDSCSVGANMEAFWVPFREQFIPSVSIESGYVVVHSRALTTGRSQESQ